MSRPTLIEVPYHLGRRGAGMADGQSALSSALAADGIRVVTVEPAEESTNEIGSSMAVVRALAEVVRGVEFPVALAANCNSSLGTVTGIGGDVGVIWFDAHDDFNTP